MNNWPITQIMPPTINAGITLFSIYKYLLYIYSRDIACPIEGNVSPWRAVVGLWRQPLPINSTLLSSPLNI